MSTSFSISLPEFMLVAALESLARLSEAKDEDETVEVDPSFRNCDAAP